MLWLFVSMTVIAFLFHILGLNWFSSVVELPAPPEIIQELIKALLKAFELVLVYRLLTHKSFGLCILISIIQVAAVGFLPQNFIQSLADAVLMIVLPVILRKDKVNALWDFLFVYIVLNLYGLLVVATKFVLPLHETNFDFYTNILSLIDYKLFVVTLYLYVRCKGGVKLWKIKRKLLTQPDWVE